MKKGLYLLVIISMALLLSGCQKGMAQAVAVGTDNTKYIESNTKFLKCSLDIDDGIPETVESNRTIEIFYQNYIITKVTLLFGYRLDDSFTENAVTTLEQSIISKQKSKYNKYAPIVVGANRKGTNSFEITIEVEYLKLDEEEKGELQLEFAGDYSEDRRFYENSGYTCE